MELVLMTFVELQYRYQDALRAYDALLLAAGMGSAFYDTPLYEELEPHRLMMNSINKEILRRARGARRIKRWRKKYPMYRTA